ncbi:hypothetical protein EMN47_02175 [Prolixibacteraceae bacterium JC049]|nr:hypothetical protein [Prolixibacteraceae bacterium JC049]
MKIKNIRKVSLFLLALGTMFITSCENGDSLHQEWLEKGERVYAAKVDSVSVHGGDERAKIEVNVTVKNLEKVIAYWNANADSIELPINQKKGFFDITVENLSEQSYLFNFVSVDIYGNRSLPFEAVGDVYGSYYKSTLTNRRYKALKAINGDVVLEFDTALEEALFSEVTYMSTDGSVKSVNVPVADESLAMADYKSDLKYRTAYKPNELALDTFYTAYFDKFPARLKIDKSSWKIADFSSAHSMGGDHKPSNLIDDNPATSWHTKVNWSTGENYPHYIVVDLGTLTTIKEMDLYADTDDGRGWGPSEFEIYVSKDGKDATKVGTFNFDPNNTDAQTFQLNVDTPIQFVKLVATKPSKVMEGGQWGAQICILGELDLFK